MKKVSCRTVDIYHTLLLLIFGGLNFHDFGDYKEIAKSKVRENKLPCGGGGGGVVTFGTYGYRILFKFR